MEAEQGQETQYNHESELTRAVFSGLLNSAPRCVVLLTLEHSGPLSPSELYNVFQEVSGGVWQMNRRSQAGSCQNVLVPAGLVQESDLPGEYYEITDQGRNHGLPIARFILHQATELRIPHSLQTIFGPANSKTEITAAITRTRILRVLAQNEGSEITEIELENSIGISRKVIGPTLAKLRELGLVNFESVDFEDSGWTQYQLRQGAIREMAPLYHYRPTLSQQVIDILFEYGTVSADFICRCLPNVKQSTSHHISNILRYLTKHGICDDIGFQSGIRHSFVSITELGNRLKRELIEPIFYATANDDRGFSAQWAQLEWRSVVPELIQTHAAESGSVNSASTNERRAQILHIIEEAGPQGIRPRDLFADIPRRMDILKQLLEEGIVTQRKEGKLTYYSLAGEP